MHPQARQRVEHLGRLAPRCMPAGACTTSRSGSPRAPDRRIGRSEDHHRPGCRMPPPCAPGPESLPTNRARAGEQILDVLERRSGQGSGMPGTARDHRTAAPMNTGSRPGIAQMLAPPPESRPPASVFVGCRGQRDESRRSASAGGCRCGEQLRSRNLHLRRAQIEHRAGQMLRGVDLALLAQNLLRARESARCTRTGGGNARSPPGSGRPETAVIQALRVPPWRLRHRPRAEAREARPRRAAESRRTSGLPSKMSRKRSLHHDGEAQVGTAAFQNLERGRGEHAISERPQPEDRPPGCPAANILRRSARLTYSSIFASSTSITGMSSRIG